MDLWINFDWHEIKVQRFFDDLLIEPNQAQFDEFVKRYEIPYMIENWNPMNQLYLNIMNDCCNQMSLQLISTPGCDSKSWTISVWPFPETKIKGVLWNKGIQCQKRFKIEI